MSKRESVSASRDKTSPKRDKAPPKEGDQSRAADQQRIAELENRLRATDQALRLSTSKLRMALDIGKLGSWERDLETNIVTGSPAFRTYLGLPLDAELTYEDLKKTFHPGDAERIAQAVAYSLRTRTDFNIEHRVIRGDGRVGRVLARGGPVFEGDKPIRIAGILLDVTDREKAREEATLAHRRQEFLLELNDQIGTLDDPALIMETAARSLALFLKLDSSGLGEFRDERSSVLIEREWSKGLINNEGHIQPYSSIPQDVWNLFRAGQPLVVNDVKTDPRLSAPELQEMFASTNVRTTISAPVLRNGRPTALLYASTSQPKEWTSEEIALVEDVAERTWIAVEKASAERELRETEARFQMIAESLPAFVWVLNPNTELTYTNQWWVTYSGFPPEEALGHSWTRAIHPDDWARMTEELKLVVSGQTPYETEARYRSAQGEYRWHLIQGAPIHSATGEFKGWVGTSVDIHDLKVTEERLRSSELQLRIALDAAKMGDWTWDIATDAMTLSDRSTEIFGLPHGTERTWTQLSGQLYPPDAAKALAAMEKAAQARADYSLEYRIRRADTGERIWVASQGRTIYDMNGAFMGMSGVVQDITDRKHAEERQQLLIRELHHRVKNTLATVQAIVGSTARTATSIDDFYQGFVGRIVSLARTHNLLTEDLWQKADLKELVETELGPYEDETRNRIIIEGPHVELPSEAAVPIGMAMHELTTNAAKHGALSTFGGQVEVRWHIEPGAERPMLHFNWIENGGPRVTAPARQGFGSRLLQRVLTTQLQAEVKMDFQEHGLHFTMTMPIPGEPPLFNPDK
ncbi:PAS domain-containing protein [Microvirga guangxiensis]|uniref:Blue-light-activated histidine kinase n=1 Tax=Microvirga guangxiensis TaxID=549386 RepID=A0A1G5C663_9HYPH|nr:PAS domain-containing protein [Microvirga guangxiensis]SCX97969.1 PAS domain S-box-containing protein [Microvirga guangxiensis]